MFAQSDDSGDGRPVKQFALAEKKGLRWMAIPGERPLSDALTLRDLASRKNIDGLSVAEAVKIISGART